MTTEQSGFSLSYPLDVFSQQQQGQFSLRPETQFAKALSALEIHISGTGADLMGGVRDMNFVCTNPPSGQILTEVHDLARAHFGPTVEIYPN